jgi:16S rRNA (adenine1518-N6/adenine1519-N6)-dimethyltransferase
LPRKLGQHFLIAESILERLAVAACGKHVARVVEIGPGRGALTRHLLPRTDELHAVELDAALAEQLCVQFASDPRVHIHHADVLEADLSAWGPAVIAGNLPYYITSPIVDRFLELPPAFGSAVFLVQWEVAERLRAKPHSRDYGFLTVKTQLQCQVELVAKVPPGAFAPPPKVDSAAVKLIRKPEPPPSPQLIEFIGRCFAHKRKMLRNNLRPFYSRAALDAMPEMDLRAEQIAVEDFARLWETLE